MTITVRSHAKINWTLDVLFRRDDGFHEIRTIYQTVSLYDRLRISGSENPIEIVCADPRVPTDSSNVVFKAAELLKKAAGVTAGVRIEIEKRIPVAAGLGGGSSNAAAALLGLTRFWGIPTDLGQLMELAAAIGSDVPFFLFGGSALGVGRGEEVYVLPEIRCDHILLANPGVAVSTAAAYGNLPRLTRQQPTRIIPITLLAANGISVLPVDGSNDLEGAVFPLYPEIAEVRRRVIELGATHALMSGSGATVFAVFDNLLISERARDQLRSEGCWSEVTAALGRDAYHANMFESW